MARPTIAVSAPLPEPAEAILRDGSDARFPSGAAPMSRAELLEAASGADGLVALLSNLIDAELLDAAGPGLRVVANVAVGYDNVDLPAARERDVVITNTPGVLTDATADLAMALILAVTRRVGEGERLIRGQAEWRWGLDFMLGHGIQGGELGIVGMGAIGSSVARRARAFGMEVSYSSPRPVPPARLGGLDAVERSLPDLLATADVVSIHAPLRPETRHLIGAAELAAMKPAAYLVNTARGPIVDEGALVEALRDGRIAGAALDVFEEEPRVHPGLLELDNVVLLPHLGSATVETRTAMAELAARNAVAVAGGGEALTPVG